MIGRYLLLLTASVAFAACSGGDFDNNEASGLSPKKILASVASKARAGSTPAANAPAAKITRAMLADVKVPLILVHFEKVGASTGMQRTVQNGAYDTWVSSEKISLSFKDGVLVTSRGLPGDLLVADADPTLAVLHARSAESYSRALRFIGGERQVLLGPMTCRSGVVGAESVEIVEQRHATIHMTETCSDLSGDVVQNDFWRGADGVMWKSRQFVHPSIGYVTVERLVR